MKGEKCQVTIEKRSLIEEIELLSRFYSCRNYLAGSVSDISFILTRDTLWIFFYLSSNKMDWTNSSARLDHIFAKKEHLQSYRSSLRILVNTVKAYTRVLSLSTITNATVPSSHQEYKRRKCFSQEQLDRRSTFLLSSKTTTGAPLFYFSILGLNKTIRSAFALVGFLNTATTCFSIEHNTL